MGMPIPVGQKRATNIQNKISFNSVVAADNGNWDEIEWH